MVQTLIRIADWVLCGHISDITYQRDAYRKAYKEKLQNSIDANKALVQLHDEYHELRAIVRTYREKEARIAHQKRESYKRIRNAR
jgi:hypothetical protein